MNFLQRPGSSNFGERYQLMTNVFRDDYCSPPGLLTGESFKADDLIETDKTLSSFNADEIVSKLVDWSHKVYSQRQGQNIMLPYGCDFTF